MSRVEVVLFVKGKGGDEASYRPQRDESQWWNRRDAIVRCVASFLLGPHCQKVDKIITLLFDEDWVRIQLEVSKSVSAKDFLPTEQNVIALLKKAAGASPPGSPVQEQGIQAKLVFPKDMIMDKLPSSLDNKRSILEYLQKTCTMDFLREKGLNSSAGAILKKTNKEKLTKVWNDWKQQNTEVQPSNNQKYLLPILRDVLSAQNETMQTVVGVLHESGEAELPVWKQKISFPANGRIVLFLGAVRDMQRIENECLATVCRETTTPQVKIRLSHVPEFTSKILSIVAFHATCGVLWPAVQNLMIQKGRKRLRPWDNAKPKMCPNLEVVCFVPINPNELVTDLEARSGILWRLVRCVVVTLWRSKVHGKDSESPLKNRLHLVFKDGTYLSLTQDELVSKLAEQHQAAPCEFQILKALEQRLSDASKDSSDTVILSKVAKSISKRIRKDSVPPYRIVLTRSGESGTRNFVHNFYATSTPDHEESNGTYLLTQQLEHTPESTTFTTAFIARFTKKEPKTLLINGEFCDACTDEIAASITMMQHIAYQNCLDGTFVGSSESFKVAKRK